MVGRHNGPLMNGRQRDGRPAGWLAMDGGAVPARGAGRAHTCGR
jgi:hypothetical protein